MLDVAVLVPDASCRGSSFLIKYAAPHIITQARGGHKFRIAVVVVATGVYTKQVALFAKSAHAYFCTDHDVQVLVGVACL